MHEGGFRKTGINPSRSCCVSIRLLPQFKLATRYLWVLLYLIPCEIFFIISLLDFYNVTHVWIKHWWLVPSELICNLAYLLYCCCFLFQNLVFVSSLTRTLVSPLISNARYGLVSRNVLRARHSWNTLYGPTLPGGFQLHRDRLVH